MNTWDIKAIKLFEDIHTVKCTLRPDGLYDVYGGIDISNKKLKDLSCLPPIYTLSGYLWADYNYLEDLQGSPMRIERSFTCTNNYLTSLEGAPEYIGGNFNCSDNANLRFTKTQILEMHIFDDILYDRWQLIPVDPSKFIEKDMLPI